jgi:hypothetical protein
VKIIGLGSEKKFLVKDFTKKGGEHNTEAREMCFE